MKVNSATKPAAKPVQRKRKKGNRMNMRFDDEMTAAINLAGAAIKVEGQDFVRMCIRKVLHEVAITGQVILPVDAGTRLACDYSTEGKDHGK